MAELYELSTDIIQGAVDKSQSMVADKDMELPKEIIDIESYTPKEKSPEVKALEKFNRDLLIQIQTMKREKDEHEHPCASNDKTSIDIETDNTNSPVQVEYHQVVYPVGDDKKARFATYDEIKHVFDGLTIEPLRQKFREYGHFKFEDWYNDGLKIIERCVDGFIPSNRQTNLKHAGTPQIYFGASASEMEENPSQHVNGYWGQTRNGMDKRNDGHLRDWSSGREKAFCKGIRSTGNVLSYTILSFEETCDGENDLANIMCLERCVFIFNKYMNRSDMLYNSNKANSLATTTKSTEKITDLSSQVKAGLVIWANGLGLATKNRSFISLKKTKKTVEKTYVCSKCLMASFTNLAEKEGHESKCVEIAYQCFMCKKRFDSKRGLCVHVNVKHSNQGQTNFPCPACKKIFKRKSRLNLHFKFQHDPSHKRQRLRCEICSVNLFKDGLRKHMFYQHGIGQ